MKVSDNTSRETLLCFDKIYLDDKLSNFIKEKFITFSKDLKDICQVSIDRFNDRSFREEIYNIELHCFCNYSLQAFASVIHLIVATNIVVKVKLICSKTKVVPLKNLTIGSLEHISCFLNGVIIIYDE